MPHERAVIPVPSYGDYAAALYDAGREVRFLGLEEESHFALDWRVLEECLQEEEIVLLGQPNNPTGQAFDVEALRALSARRPLNMFVVDEAYADFIDGYRSLADESLGGIVVVRSLTKFYAIPGLRLGYAVANPTVASAIRTFMLPWSVNLLAQEAALEMLCDDDYRRRSVRLVGDLRRELARELSAIPGLYVYPSVANFLLVRLDRSDLTAPELAERLLRVGIAIRTFAPPPTTAGSARSARSGGSSGSANFPPGQHLNEDVIRLLVELGPGLRRLAKAAQPLDERFFRVAVRTEGENRRLCAALASVLGVSRRVQPIPRRAAALMIQGTSSNAGKSVLTAALCRILLRDGIRVAPFKSQNMSLNSFVTRDGGEMGRAQVVQAQACRLEPDVRMNPILLKPCSDTGCQVIVRGQPVGNMRVAEYVAYKPRAFSAARECYDSLAAEFDAIVLEGAGSPGEVNLKSHDIVNMRMAEYAERRCWWWETSTAAASSPRLSAPWRCSRRGSGNALRGGS